MCLRKFEAIAKGSISRSIISYFFCLVGIAFAVVGGSSTICLLLPEAIGKVVVIVILVVVVYRSVGSEVLAHGDGL